MEHWDQDVFDGLRECELGMAVSVSLIGVTYIIVMWRLCLFI